DNGGGPLAPGKAPVADYKGDQAFQALGLQTSPTPFTFTDGTTPDAEFTLTVGTSSESADVIVFLPGSSAYETIDDLVTALQQAVDTALQNSALGKSDSDGDGVPDVLVCRPSDNPDLTGIEACRGTGNRISFRGEAGVITTLAINVPPILALGPNATTAKGAVTMLGYAPTQGETRQARASRFFLDDVSLSGTFDLVIQDVSVTANVGFLGIKARAPARCRATVCSRS